MFDADISANFSRRALLRLAAGSGVALATQAALARETPSREAPPPRAIRTMTS